MLYGTIIAESLRPGCKIEVPGLRLAQLARADVADSTADDQPTLWTFLHVEAPQERAAELAEALAAALRREGGWYADFRVGGEHVVVFAGRVFRYRVGDAAARQAAVDYGRAAGVPEHQLDWGD